MDVKNEIKSYIVREGLTMKGVLYKLYLKYGWSRSASNFSDKLTRGSIQYREVKELADVLGYELVWKKKHDG